MHTKTTALKPSGSGAAELVLAGSNLALLLILAATTDPARVGLLAAGLAAMHVLGRLAVFGVDREVSALLPLLKMRRGRRQLVLAGQAAVLRASGVLLGAGFAIAAVLEISGSAAPASAPIAIALGAAGLALFDYGTSRRPPGLGHPSAGIQRLAMPISRVSIASASLMLLPSRPDLALLAYALATLAFGLPPFLWAERRLGGLDDEALVARLMRRTLWRGVEDAGGAVALHAGTLLLVVLGLWTEAATYAVALALATTLHAALSPFERSLRVRAARLRTEPGIGRYLARSMASGVGLALLGAPALVVLGWWIPLLVPALAGLHAPLWLLAGFIVLLVVDAPIAVVSRALKQPRVLAVARLAWLALVITLGLLWAPGAGAAGAALAQLTAAAASLAVLGGLAAVVGRPARRGLERPSKASAQERASMG